MDAQACRGDGERAGARVDLEAFDTLEPAGSQNGAGQRVGVAVAGGEALLVAGCAASAGWDLMLVDEPPDRPW